MANHKMASNIMTIKVGTFNLMNLMLPDKPAYGGTLYYSQSEYSRKAKWVEFMLNQMDADVICFQELFHREALTRIIKNMPKYRRAHLYVADETGDQPCVALLSRYPVENVEVYEEFPDDAIIDFNPRGKERVVLPFNTFTRPVLKADIRIDGYGIITFFSVHLKSKREIFYVNEDQQDPVDLARAQSRSLMLRAAESVALRAIIAESLRIPERPVVVCGDVNDIGTSVTTRIISGDVPEHRLSDRVKKRIWDVLLYHVKDIQARRSYQDFYYTHIHNGMYESLDHIMVSQELVTEYPRNTGRVGLVSVYNDHLVDQTFTQQKQDKCKSDHGVVVCSLELDPERASRFMAHENSDEYEDEADESDDMTMYPGSQAEDITGNDIVDAVRKFSPDPDIYESLDDVDSDDTETPVSEKKEVKESVASEKFDFQKSLDKWQERNGQYGKRTNSRRKRKVLFMEDESRNEPKPKTFRRDDREKSEPAESAGKRNLFRCRNVVVTGDKAVICDNERIDSHVEDVQKSEPEKVELTTTTGGRKRHVRRGSISTRPGLSNMIDDDIE